MIFFLVMPGLYGGFGNFIVPLHIGSSEVEFPRINCYSFYLLTVSALGLVVVMALEFPGGSGWTLYPPLSVSLVITLQMNVIIDCLIIAGFSSVTSSVNFFSTLANMRTPSYNLIVLPLYVWAIFITLYLLLFTLPILTGALGILLLDMQFNTVFLDPSFGGDPVLYQHFFWFFGHPEVYILIIPAFGIVSQILSEAASRSVFGNQSMILAMICISLFGSFVWAHHMYTVGIEADTRAYFTSITILISIPTGTKILNWISTILGNYLKICISNAVLFILAFLIMFTFGGTTGIILGNAAMDVTLHDSYYVVAHFHFVLSLGAVLSFIAGCYYYVNLFMNFISISCFTSFYSRLYFIVVFLGIVITFTPMFFLGFNFQPRRMSDFPENYNCWNFLSSMGSGLVFMSSLLLTICLWIHELI